MLRTILIYVVLTSIWTWLAVSLNEFTRNDTGLITGIGYLALFSISIWLGRGRLDAKKLFSILGINFVLFSLSSFLLLPLISIWSESIWLYRVINSIVLAIAYVWMFNKIYTISYKWLSLILISTSVLIAYWIIELEPSFLKYELDLNHRMMTFSIFQGLLTVALSISLNLKRTSPNKTQASSGPLQSV